MLQELDYYPTGKFMQFPAHEVFSMTDRRVAVAECRRAISGRGSLLIKTTTVNGKEGEIMFGDNDDIEIMLKGIGDTISSALNGDLFIIISTSEMPGGEPIVLVVHLDEAHYGQHEQYKEFDGAFYPLGIEGDIIYAAAGRDNRVFIEGFNVLSREVECRYGPNGEYFVR